MAVSAQIIEAMSPFKLNADFTSTDLTIFNGWADDKFSDDKVTGLSAAKEEQAVALLVCHFIARKKTDVGMNSENLGGYTYSRAVAGKTGYLIEYEDLIKKNSTPQPSAGTLRSDHQTSKDFRTENLPVPSMDYTDSTLSRPEYPRFPR